MSATANIQRVDRNPRGRDFVVGDIHGEFSRVRAALKRLDFDPASDRLFCTGDLVDRGPESPAVLEWLAQPWFHSVCGNHEAMLLEQNGDVQRLAWWLRCNGGQWWEELAPERRQDCLEAFARLPLALEIEAAGGDVGIVHADVPPWLDWPALRARLQDQDRDLRHYLLWERRRISFLDDTPVAGIQRVFCGHTPLSTPRRLGNLYFIDTGICYGGEVTILSLTGEPAA